MIIIGIVVGFYRVEATVKEIQNSQRGHIELNRKINMNIEKEIIYRQQLLSIAEKSKTNAEQMNVLLTKLSVTLDNINNKLK